MRPKYCERIGCNHTLVHQTRGKPRRFCCFRCASLDRARRKHDGADPPLTAEHRGYIEAFTLWLKEPSAEHAERRTHALADLMAKTGIKA